MKSPAQYWVQFNKTVLGAPMETENIPAMMASVTPRVRHLRDSLSASWIEANALLEECQKIDTLLLKSEQVAVPNVEVGISIGPDKYGLAISEAERIELRNRYLLTRLGKTHQRLDELEAMFRKIKEIE